MIEWIPVYDSTRVVAEGYDPQTETIYVRFPNGVEWWYSGCPAHIWEEYSKPGQSRGQYIKDFLNYKPNGRHSS